MAILHNQRKYSSQQTRLWRRLLTTNIKCYVHTWNATYNFYQIISGFISIFLICGCTDRWLAAVGCRLISLRGGQSYSRKFRNLVSAVPTSTLMFPETDDYKATATTPESDICVFRIASTELPEGVLSLEKSSKSPFLALFQRIWAINGFVREC